MMDDCKTENSAILCNYSVNASSNENRMSSDVRTLATSFLMYKIGKWPPRVSSRFLFPSITYNLQEYNWLFYN